MAEQLPPLVKDLIRLHHGKNKEPRPSSAGSSRASGPISARYICDAVQLVHHEDTGPRKSRERALRVSLKLSLARSRRVHQSEFTNWLHKSPYSSSSDLKAARRILTLMKRQTPSFPDTSTLPRKLSRNISAKALEVTNRLYKLKYPPETIHTCRDAEKPEMSRLRTSKSQISLSSQDWSSSRSTAAIQFSDYTFDTTKSQSAGSGKIRPRTACASAKSRCDFSKDRATRPKSAGPTTHKNKPEYSAVTTEVHKSNSIHTKAKSRDNSADTIDHELEFARTHLEAYDKSRLRSSTKSEPTICVTSDHPAHVAKTQDVSSHSNRTREENSSVTQADKADKPATENPQDLCVNKSTRDKAKGTSTNKGSSHTSHYPKESRISATQASKDIKPVIQTEKASKHIKAVTYDNSKATNVQQTKTSKHAAPSPWNLKSSTTKVKKPKKKPVKKTKFNKHDTERSREYGTERHSVAAEINSKRATAGQAKINKTTTPREELERRMTRRPQSAVTNRNKLATDASPGNILQIHITKRPQSAVQSSRELLDKKGIQRPRSASYLGFPDNYLGCGKANLRMKCFIRGTKHLPEFKKLVGDRQILRCSALREKTKFYVPEKLPEFHTDPSAIKTIHKEIMVSNTILQYPCLIPFC